MKRLLHWLALAAGSAALSLALSRLAVPAALLLGPMLCAVAFALSGSPLKMPRTAFLSAQAVIGCQVAGAVTASTLVSLARDWPLMLFSVAAAILAGAVSGLTLMRFGSLPGDTAAWGTSPGGAGAMTAMAEAHGADVRLVAFMQYLRVFVVVLTASTMTRLLTGRADVAASRPDVLDSLFTTAPLIPFLATMALAAAGVLAAPRLPFPAGALLVPMAAGALANALGAFPITVTPLVSFAAYAVLGWQIGLRFTGEAVRQVTRLLPQMLLSAFLIIALCGGIAWTLTRFAGLDALTAYLATTPGGLDSVAVMAMGGGADAPFVLALQGLRLFAVIMAGPQVARLLCRVR
jgi:hypothetical protein